MSGAPGPDGAAVKRENLGLAFVIVFGIVIPLAVGLWAVLR